MAVVKIGNKLVGDGQSCFLVGEIGINHNGNLEIAKKLIDVAVASGCDAIKFQKRTVDVVYSAEDLAKPRENPFGKTNGDLKKGLEFGLKEFKEINRYCKEKKILWFASCWDEASVDFIDRFNPPCYKIASASLTDKNLLLHTKKKGKPLILSTAMSTLAQIKKAVALLGKKNLIILHCVATYPTEDHELHLRVIQTLKKQFPDILVGYSGHGYGTTPAVCAVALGACVVERHITLDRAMWGSDQAASLEPVGLAHMIKNIRRLELALGDGVKRVLDSEVPIMRKLRRKQNF